MKRVTSALMAATLLAVSSLPAQQLPPVSRPWTENFDHFVEVNGTASAEARLFNARGRPAMLLLAPELSTPLLIDLQKRQVNAVPAEAVKELPEGQGVELVAEAVEGSPAPYTMDGETVIFYWNGVRTKITRKPPLVGDITLENLLARLPIYRKGMEAYEPGISDVSYLKDYGLQVKVLIFFGSWCPHCRQTIPRFLKSMEAAGNANIAMAFTGVPLPFKDYAPAQEKQVKGVPTFIVYAGDKEIGRFGAIPEGSSAEHELVKILYAHAQRRG
ncbi:MAG: thioredoxin family protein [Candidatus Polarisedimenticolia bacterium]